MSFSRALIILSLLVFFSCDNYRFYKKDGEELFTIFPGTFTPPIGIEPSYKDIDKNQCGDSNIDALSNLACFERASIDMGWEYDIYSNELYKSSLITDEYKNIECDPIYGEHNSYYIMPYVYLKGLSNLYSSLNIWATNHLYIGQETPPPIRFYSNHDISYCQTIDDAGLKMYKDGEQIECKSLRDTIDVYPVVKRVYNSEGVPTQFQAYVGDLKLDIPSKTDTVIIYAFGENVWGRPIYFVREGCDRMHTGISY